MNIVIIRTITDTRPRNESDIILIENYNVIKDSKNVANTLNEYVINIAEYTVGRQITALPSQDIEISISEIINKHKNHISIQNIKNKKLNSTLTFEKTTSIDSGQLCISQFQA